MQLGLHNGELVDPLRRGWAPAEEVTLLFVLPESHQLFLDRGNNLLNSLERLVKPLLRIGSTAWVSPNQT
jgi:hypothetical protein